MSNPCACRCCGHVFRFGDTEQEAQMKREISELQSENTKLRQELALYKLTKTSEELGGYDSGVQRNPTMYHTETGFDGDRK